MLHLRSFFFFFRGEGFRRFEKSIRQIFLFLLFYFFENRLLFFLLINFFFLIWHSRRNLWLFSFHNLDFRNRFCCLRFFLRDYGNIFIRVWIWKQVSKKLSHRLFVLLFCFLFTCHYWLFLHSLNFFRFLLRLWTLFFFFFYLVLLIFKLNSLNLFLSHFLVIFFFLINMLALIFFFFEIVKNLF